MEVSDVRNISNKNDTTVHLVISFKKLCIAAVTLPLFTLVFCFATAYIYQQDDIHETHCRVYNILPSISAITGITPQTYLWRVSIALHIGPRLLIASVYYSYYKQIIMSIKDPSKKSSGHKLLNICYWFNVLEVASLCGVTYISNKENYAVHEKTFILFMSSSLAYMLAAIKVGRLITPDAQSLRYKQFFFTTNLISTVGLIVFFLKHRLLCHDLAFSWFSFCEYLIAAANMGFHITVILDFPVEQLVIGNTISKLKAD